MEILPAIDLKDQHVVRLTRGDYSQVKIYSKDPLATAKKWVEAGANWLHLVDLDAALEGKPVNFKVIEDIGRFLKSEQKQFEIGGGIREEKTLIQYIENAGASRVILGTAAYQKPEFVKEACRAYPGKIAVGIDVKDGKVATHGWVEVQELSAADLARRFEDVGAACIVYTDIARDGALTGVDAAATAGFARQVGLPVIASGGVAGLADIAALAAYAGDGVVGAICGRALYDGRLDPKAALRVASGEAARC